MRSVSGISGTVRGSVASSEYHACILTRVLADTGDGGMTGQDPADSGSS